MVRYSPDHKQKTRNAIIDAAAERMRTGGLDAVGVAGIMAECGLTHGGFYAHFASREALLVAAIERLFDKATDGVWRRCLTCRSLSNDSNCSSTWLGLSDRPCASCCNSKTASTLSATLSLRKIDASWGK